jgi:hypothetical protein
MTGFFEWRFHSLLDIEFNSRICASAFVFVVFLAAILPVSLFFTLNEPSLFRMILKGIYNLYTEYNVPRVFNG